MDWLPFDLHPEYPPEGIPRAELNRRYGESFHERLESAFEREGLLYNPPPEMVPNSSAALRLTELARASEKHAPTHDRLMRAYWEEGQNIGDPEVLRTLATELRLDDAEAAITADLHGEDVARATAEAQAIGINAIPAFLLDGRLIVLGAQPDEVFEQAFDQLARA
ncbi:MAG TPA: DsbA family protein [Gaiellaceae bacterium]|nr:DsbA family protein [Gaiellaceae bacterium]